MTSNMGREVKSQCTTNITVKHFYFSRLQTYIALLLLSMASVSRADASFPEVLEAAQADSSVNISVYSNEFRWRTDPAAIVRARLTHPSGTAVMAETVSDSRTGEVSLRFEGSSEDGLEIRIDPESKLEVSVEGQVQLDVAIPRLSAFLDMGDEVIIGEAPPSSIVEIRFGSDPLSAPVGRIQTSDFGAFEFPIPPDMEFRHGQISVTIDEIAFQTYFGLAETEIVVGTNRIAGGSSMGDVIKVQCSDQRLQLQVQPNTTYENVPRWVATCSEPVSPGDVVNVQIIHPGGNKIESSTVVPVLGVQYSRDKSAIEGPPGTAVLLEMGTVAAVASGRPDVATQILLDDSGKYHIDQVMHSMLRPGWMIQAEIDFGQGVVVQSRHIIRAIKLALHDSYLTGVLASNVPVTATLFGPDGSMKARRTQQTSAGGTFSAHFVGIGPANRSFIEPGDIVEIDEVSAGDPIRISVPSVSVRVDPNSDRLEGNALPNTELRVYASPPASSEMIAAGSTNQQGDFYFDLQGVLDIQPGMNGYLEIVADERVVIFAGWSAVRLDLTLSPENIRLKGNTPVGYPARIVYRTASGDQIGTQELRSGPLSPNWAIDVRDEVGFPIRPVPGDRIEVEVGGSIALLTIPQFLVAIDVTEDTITGLAPPDSELEVHIMHELKHDGKWGAETTVRTDSLGEFTWITAPEFDIINRDRLSVSAVISGSHVIEWQRYAPGLVLDLSEGRLATSAVPGESLVVSLLDNTGLRLGVWGTTANDMGEVELYLVQASGERVVPTHGERVVISSPDGTVVTALQVPELDVSVNEQGARFEGIATGGGMLGIHIAEGYVKRQFGYGGTLVDVSRQERFSVPFSTFEGDSTDTEFSIIPGQVIRLHYQLPDGSQVIRSRQIPIVSVPVGNALVCGLADPGHIFVAMLQSEDGHVIAQGQAKVDADRMLRLTLADEAGQPVPAMPGQTVELTVDGDPFRSIAVPPATIRTEWSAPPNSSFSALPYTQIDGVLLGATAFLITDRISTDDLCASGVKDNARLSWSDYTTVTGEFSAGIEMALPGQGFELSFVTGSGHRAHRHVVRPLVHVYLGEGRVDIRATPLSAHSVSLDRSGETIGLANVRTNVNGSASVILLSDDGEPIVSRPGDQVTVHSSESSSSVSIERLAYDFSTEDGLELYTTPESQLELKLYLDDDRKVQITRVSDLNGRQLLTPQDIPPRSNWELDDVWRIEVLLRTRDGHGIAVGANLRKQREAELHKIFMPLARKSY